VRAVGRWEIVLVNGVEAIMGSFGTWATCDIWHNNVGNYEFFICVVIAPMLADATQ
jgi:hypothetical protein